MPGHPDGSGYYRMFQPFKQLTEYSRHQYMIPPPGRVVPPPQQGDLDGVDVLVTQRPVGAGGMKTYDTLMHERVAMVYEIDDDLLRVDPSSLAHLADPRLRDSMVYMMSRAQMITCSTPYLAEWLSQWNPNTVVLQNCIHEDTLRLNRIQRDRVTFGWAGGTSHLPDWCAVQDPVRDFLQSHPDVDMHFIGTDFSPLVHRECLWSSWSDNVWDYYRKVDFDVGLAPLADIIFNRSKSHLKALDYAAMGVPVIASNMEPYRDFVVDGQTGYLCSTPEEWRTRMHEMANDRDMREEMGRKAREIASQWTIQKRWPEWEAAYEKAAS